MRGTPRRASGSGRVQAALVCAAGLAILWWRWSRPEPPPDRSRSAPVTAAGAGAARPIGASAQSAERLAPRGAPGAVVMNSAETDRHAVVVSELPEWGRFRYEHTNLAIATEMAVRWALNTPVPMREVATACTRDAPVAPEIILSAEISIRERDVIVQGFGCDAEHDGRRDLADRFCDCLLERLPRELHVEVPRDILSADLAPYDGMLSLRQWQL